MNLFQKYGIKEVADVVFYSITTIGDEEFYTPVLFLDTLKVSTLEKTAEKVEARGGKGNKKLITWNFGKEITLNLEDALFSPASMSMIWGGKLNSKLSKYTSAIVKGNLANKYYDFKYSTKAYPSPALTEDEWELIYSIAEKVRYNSESETRFPSDYLYKENNEEQQYISENRNSFLNKYFNRNRKRVFDKLILSENTILNLPNIEPKKYNHPLAGETFSNKIISFWLSKEDLERIKKDDFTSPMPMHIHFTYVTAEEKNGEYFWGEEKKIFSCPIALYIEKDNTGELKITDVNYNDVTKLQIENDTNWDSFFAPENLDDALRNYLQLDLNSMATQIVDSEEFLETIEDKPIPEIILNEILKEIKSIEQIGYLETDIQDIEVIDRMEKCIVKERNGLKISTQKQKDNLFKYYSNNQQSSYTIYYDAKTMLPLFPIENGIIQDENDEFTIKMGTVYYKWTRTVKYKESDDDAILGKTLVIDAETFPDAYKIVGETYIRNQKTGKDQRYQFIIHRANVSTDTSVTLEAEGDPTTFSMQIDVLTPPNDIMMELKQYDVEDDPFEGGTRIVPQKSKYTYTPTNIEYVEEVADKNEEIY